MEYKNPDFKFIYEVPFTMIDSSVIFSEKLTVYQKTVYIVLCAFASNDNKACYPSYDTIAKKAGCSRRKVIDVISELESMGYVEKQIR